MSGLAKVWILTLFPRCFSTLTGQGVTGKAFGKYYDLHFISLSDFSLNDHHGVDAPPYGGGAGMILRADVLERALFEGVIEQGGYGKHFKERLEVVSFSPRGKMWNQELCRNFSEKYFSNGVGEKKDLVLVCGRYEGIDERFIDLYVNIEISIGNFIVSNGDLAAILILDSLIRLIPGVVGNAASLQEESFEENLLEHPQYTRPQIFQNKKVPDVLLSGDHRKIKDYRRRERLRITASYRENLASKD